MSWLRRSVILTGVLVMIALPVWVMAQTPTPTNPPVPPPTLTYAPTQSPSAGQISYGDTVSGTFAAGVTVIPYAFVGHTGEIVAARLSIANYGKDLYLRDSFGNNVAIGIQSSGPAQEVLLLPFQLSADDTYTLWLQDSYASAGDYTLHLDTPELISAPFGEAAQGQLTVEQPLVYYCFNGHAGDIINLGVNSSDFDAFVLLSQFGAVGYTPIVDDNSGGNKDALIGPYTLPADGLYLITVRSADGLTPGNFTLNLGKVEAHQLAYGDSVQAVFTEQTSYLYYSFQGHVGDTVQIHVAGQEGFDTALTLFDVNNYPVATDDDGGDGYNPEVNNLSLQYDGTYHFKLSPFTAGSTGTVTLTLNIAQAYSLDEGTVVFQLNQKQNQAIMTFQGFEGQSVGLHLWMSGNCSPIISITQNGHLIATMNLNELSSFTAILAFPADGEVQVQVNSYADMEILATLERGEGSSPEG